MNELKKRLARIEARVGSGEPAPLRTFADLMIWEYNHRDPKTGKLTPEDNAWLNAQFKAFMDEPREGAK